MYKEHLVGQDIRALMGLLESKVNKDLLDVWVALDHLDTLGFQGHQDSLASQEKQEIRYGAVVLSQLKSSVIAAHHIT